jgi:hypothetical protein
MPFTRSDVSILLQITKVRARIKANSINLSWTTRETVNGRLTRQFSLLLAPVRPRLCASLNSLELKTFSQHISNLPADPNKDKLRPIEFAKNLLEV